MRKIPTVFRRAPENRRNVLPDVVSGCEWVLAGEGVATRKYDGTCCMLDVTGYWWARREIKPGKHTPKPFVLTETDPATGKTVGWEPIANSGFAKWHGEALDRARAVGDVLPPGTYELCGPKVNGNPEGYQMHVLVPHDFAERVEVDVSSFDTIRAAVLALGARGIEGVVWHHPGGRMAKAKARDFIGTPPGGGCVRHGRADCDDCFLEATGAIVRDFGDLAGEQVIGPVRFQGGVIFLHGYGCIHCGNAFWTEDDDKRRLPPGVHRCPHCGVESKVER